MNSTLLIVLAVNSVAAWSVLAYLAKRRQAPILVWPFRIPWTVVLLGLYHVVLGLASVVLVFLASPSAVRRAWVFWLYIVIGIVFLVLGTGVLKRQRWARAVLTGLWVIWAITDLSILAIAPQAIPRPKYVHWASVFVCLAVVLGLYVNRNGRAYFGGKNAAA